ncbi:MAG: hypothetical protein CMM25_07210, partial [Rhodospirillaceae bacterium]|nr:hypothetical protein [Rhodospirillaceae bacterium]
MTALFFIIVLLSFLGYLGGKNKALRLGAGKDRKLKSLPAYHGAYVALWCFIPSILLIILWFLFNDAWLQMLVIASLPNEFKGLSPNKLSLLLSEVRNISSGFDSVSQISGVTDQIFQNYLKLKSLLFNAIFTTVALVSLTGLYYSNNKILISKDQSRTIGLLEKNGQFSSTELNKIISKNKSYAKSHLTYLRQTFIENLNLAYYNLTSFTEPLISSTKN